MFCEKCGTQVEAGSVFCDNCGARMPQAVAQAPVVEPQPERVQQAPALETNLLKPRFCTCCGNSVDGGTKFCQKCGTPLPVVNQTGFSPNNNSGYSGNAQSYQNTAAYGQSSGHKSKAALIIARIALLISAISFFLPVVPYRDTTVSLYDIVEAPIRALLGSVSIDHLRQVFDYFKDTCILYCLIATVAAVLILLLSFILNKNCIVPAILSFGAIVLYLYGIFDYSQNVFDELKHCSFGFYAFIISLLAAGVLFIVHTATRPKPIKQPMQMGVRQ